MNSDMMKLLRQKHVSGASQAKVSNESISMHGHLYSAFMNEADTALAAGCHLSAIAATRKAMCMLTVDRESVEDPALPAAGHEALDRERCRMHDTCSASFAAYVSGIDQSVHNVPPLTICGDQQRRASQDDGSLGAVAVPELLRSIGLAVPILSFLADFPQDVLMTSSQPSDIRSLGKEKETAAPSFTTTAAPPAVKPPTSTVVWADPTLANSISQSNKTVRVCPPPPASLHVGLTAASTSAMEPPLKMPRQEAAPAAAPSIDYRQQQPAMRPPPQLVVPCIVPQPSSSKFVFGPKGSFAPPQQQVASQQQQPAATPKSDFVSAYEQLQKENAAASGRQPTLGLRRNPPGAFNPPYAQQPPSSAPPHTNNSSPEAASESNKISKVVAAANQSKKQQPNQSGKDDEDQCPIPEFLLLPDGSVPPILQACEPKLVQQICREILEARTTVTWEDIAGLKNAKEAVTEAIVWPLVRPDLFAGLRSPPRGLLLFGPPGTGKTLVARAIASTAECTFFSISSSSLMSKWVGEGEKMVRCLFAVATVKQPSVIFVDEIDSLLSMRGEGEMDAVRRVKTEFLVQLDGVGTASSDRVLLIGATNRPEELDEAARRRMERRLYIPLPNFTARLDLMKRLMSKGTAHSLTDDDFSHIAGLTVGFSGADMNGFCREAAMGPLRANKVSLSSVTASDIRPVHVTDFESAMKRMKPSVGKTEVMRYKKWNTEFGSFADDVADDEEN